MINKIRYGAAGVALAAALGMGSVAQAQDNANATATAEILDALTLTLDSGSLNFGNIVVNGGGTAVLANDGTLTCTTVICSGTTSVPTFRVAGGTTGADVDITYTIAAPLLRAGGTVGNAADEIVLSGLNSDQAGEVITIAATDTLFNVGGTLTLDGSEVAGTYSANFNVRVTYQ